MLRKLPTRSKELTPVVDLSDIDEDNITEEIEKTLLECIEAGTNRRKTTSS